MTDDKSTALPPHLADLRKEIEGHARGYGLDFYETIFEVVGFDEMNMVAAYGGFPNRYPHWRWGMDYEQLSKGYEYGLSKIYELVINNNPSYAYLLESNMDVDQKLVMAHVFGHVDFFKNNFSFAHTNRKMMDQMANHATRVRRIIDREGIEKVEGFIDRALSLENLIDQHRPHFKNPSAREKTETDKQQENVVRGLKSDREYMNVFINPQSFLDEQRKKIEDEKVRSKKFPEKAQRDVLLFLLEHAPLDPWERDVLAIIREEAYYFAPQGQTKIANEGWACVAPETLVFTGGGLVPMREVVEGGRVVSDGERARAVTDRNVIRGHETVTIRTRRGLSLTGSNNHRIVAADGSWRRLDALAVGDEISVSGGAGLWPAEYQRLSWRPRERLTLQRAARDAGVSQSTLLRARAGTVAHSRRGAAVAAALERYQSEENEAAQAQLPSQRRPVALPELIEGELAAFLGLLVGDGHISRKKRHLGLTTADVEALEQFVALAQSLFGRPCSVKRDGGRWRVLVHSQTVSDFLIEGLGLTHGPSARFKQVPPLVLRSPKDVVAPFLRAYFDCDAYAGKAGIILSTASAKLGEQVQLLLLNFGILSRRRLQKDGCWHLTIQGPSAAVFEREIGFGLSRKRERLAAYVHQRRWFKEERWADEVVSIERGHGDVYDITVDETHRYAAAGFVNHNSYWHSKIMTQKALKADELIDYADHHSGTMATQPGQLNPYKLGIELWRHIEERWDKGRFGKEWDECDDLRARRNWDKKLGLGRKKMFEVRKHYNDITFIDEFLTPEFALEQKLFVFNYNEKGHRWEILTREFAKVKQRLLQQLTNFGQPIIEVVDANLENRGELLLMHKHEGVDLQGDYSRDTLANLQQLWRRPVALFTRVEGRGVLQRFDGKEYTERKAEY
jgi:stage V sporulation protein R